MNPEITHDHHTEQRKRKASGDDHVTNLQQQPSSSSYNINGSVDIPTICPYADNINDLDSLPIGYRFIPTDEELIKHYLMKKINNECVPKSKISDADIYESHPKDVVGKYPQAIEDGWYFFTPRNRKYARGKRPDRQAGPGCWKATGLDKVIKENDIKIGGRKSLVYYEGHAPNRIKTKWMMHEYVVEGYVRTRLNLNDLKLDDYVLCKIYINGKMKEEVATDHQQSRVAPSDLDANLATNVQVENELALVPLDQPGHIFHGDHNNVAVIQHDSGQNLNTVRTCMSSLAVSDNNNNVHSAFQVTNNVAPKSYQNMGSLYDLKPPYSRPNDSFPIRFNHEYSLQPLYIAPTPHQAHTPLPHNMQAVMYRSGPTSNLPMPQVAPSFQEEGLVRNIECVVEQHGYDGFLDYSYSPDFNGIDEYIDADQSKIN